MKLLGVVSKWHLPMRAWPRTIRLFDLERVESGPSTLYRLELAGFVFWLCSEDVFR